MSENVLETIRATVQDFIAPELKTHGVRLTNLEQRLGDARHSLEQRADDLKSSLEHRIDDSKDLLRAEIRATEAKLEARFTTLGLGYRRLRDRFRI